jgi:hypothetical protein
VHQIAKLRSANFTGIEEAFETYYVIGPVFQPDCRLVAVTPSESGINDGEK